MPHGYVMIIIVQTFYGPPQMSFEQRAPQMSTTTAQFSSNETCEEAAKKLMAAPGQNIVAYCFKQ